MVYEPLVKYQADGTVTPWLAKSWTHSADGKIWTFTLRDDVTFSNGEPFDAAAAAANFRAVLANRKRHAWLELVNQLVDVTATGKYQLRITLKKRLLPVFTGAGSAAPVPLYRPVAVS